MARKGKSASVPEPEVFDDQVEEETVIEPAPKAEKPVHSSRIISLAEDFGMSKAEIESYEPERLADIVYNLTKHAIRANRQPVPEQRPQPAPESAPVQQAEPDEFAHLRGKYDDEIVDSLSKLSKRNKELEAGQKKFAEETQAREQQTYMNILDDAFADLPQEYQRLLGAGGIREIEPNSPEHQRRKAIFSAAGIDFSQRPGARLVNQKIKAAAQMLLGHQIPPPPKEPEATGLYGEPAGETRPREQPLRDPDTGRILPKAHVDAVKDSLEWATGLERPTHRVGAKEPAGRAKAEKSVSALIREMQAAPDNAATGYPSQDDFL